MGRLMITNPLLLAAGYAPRRQQRSWYGSAGSPVPTLWG